MKIDFPENNALNDRKGFEEHCKVAALIINEMEINPHTKHHIRSAIREATHKVTEKKGSCKATAHFMSESAHQQMQHGSMDNLVLEHVVPVSYINQRVLELSKQTKPITMEQIAKIVLEFTCLALITKEEDGGLTNKTVPTGICTNKFARYTSAEPPIILQPNIYKELKKVKL